MTEEVGGDRNLAKTTAASGGPTSGGRARLARFQASQHACFGGGGRGRQKRNSASGEREKERGEQGEKGEQVSEGLRRRRLDLQGGHGIEVQGEDTATARYGRGAAWV